MKSGVMTNLSKEEEANIHKSFVYEMDKLIQKYYKKTDATFACIISFGFGTREGFFSDKMAGGGQDSLISLLSTEQALEGQFYDDDQPTM